MSEPSLPIDSKILLENNARLESTLLANRKEINLIKDKYDKQLLINQHLMFIQSHLTVSLEAIMGSLGDSTDYSIADTVLNYLKIYLNGSNDILADDDMSKLQDTIQSLLKLRENNNNVLKNQNISDFDYEKIISNTFQKYLSVTYPCFGQLGDLRNEINRLTKQNDILYRKIQTSNSNNSSSLEIENNSEGLSANSAYIEKLTNQNIKLDKALQKSQNQLLSFKLNVLDQLKNDDTEYHKLASILNTEKLSYKNQFSQLESRHLKLLDENTKLSSEINNLKVELDRQNEINKVCQETLNDRIKMCESLKSKNIQLNKELSDIRGLLNKNIDGDDVNLLKLKLAVFEKNQADFKSLEDNLQNAIDEIEEISIAFEEKQRKCENLTRQLMLKSTVPQTYNVKIELDSLKDNFQKQLDLYSEKIRDFELVTKLYVEAWHHSYQRCLLIEQERDELLRYLHMSSERNTLLSRQLEDAKENDNTIYRHRRKNMKPGDENSLIARENAELIKRITCTVCNERFRDHVIVKCGHFFCEPCLDDNIKSRNRRCSQCKINFDKRDIQKIYF